MKIYLHTPYYKNSDFMAHLCEHLVLHPGHRTLSQAIKSRGGVSGSMSEEDTNFIIPTYIDVNKFIDRISNPCIEQQVIDYEMDIYQEEFARVGYHMRLTEKILQQLYGRDWSGRQQTYSLEEIVGYHKQYYIDAPYVVYDDNNQAIIKHTVKNAIEQNSREYPVYKYELVLLEGSKNHCFIKSYNSVFDILFNGLVLRVLEAYELTRKRYQLGSYYSYEVESWRDSKYIVISRDPDMEYSVTLEFFEEYKKQLLEMAKHNEFEYVNCNGLIYFGQYISKENIIKYVEGFQFEHLQSLIDQIK